MVMNTMSLSIPKEQIRIHKAFTNSYFETYKNTNVGNDNKYLNLTMDELTILNLPFIDIDDLIDRCMLDRIQLTKILTKLLLKIDINNIELLNKNYDENIDFYFLINRIEIKKTDNFDFNKMYDIFNKYLNTDIEKIEKYKKFLYCRDKTKNNMLLWACKNKKSKMALDLISNFGELCKPEQINNKGSTALIWACSNKMDDVALSLISNFGKLCKPEQVNNENDTALMWACYNKMNDIALSLINNFGELCKPEQISNEDCTALIWACYNNMNEVALSLISNFKELCKPEQIDKANNSALLFACKNNMNDVALSLINNFKERCIPDQLNQACCNKMNNVALSLKSNFGL